MTHPLSPSPPAGRRILGIDAARGLAVLGMLAIHLAPRSDGTWLGEVYNLPHGRASVLFVLIAGVSLGLQARQDGWSTTARLKVIWLAVVLLPLGLALQALDHNVAVILHHYAAFYLLGVLVAELPRRVLFGLAGAATVIGPLAYFLGRAAAPDMFTRQAVAVGEDWLEVVLGLTLSGPYPLLTWAGPLLWGMWIGRLALGARSTGIALLVTGAVIAAGSASLSSTLEYGLGAPEGPTHWTTLYSDAPHSQMPLWLTGSIGTATATLGCALLIVTDRNTPFHPLVALGQTALSFYVAHLIVLHILRDFLPIMDFALASVVLAGAGAAAMAVAAIWLQHFTRGPLEAVLLAPFWLLQADPRRSGSGDER